MTQCNTRNSRIAAGLKDPYTILNFSRNSTPGIRTLSHPPTPIPMSSPHQSAHQSAQPKSAHIDPTDDETPNETPAVTMNPEEAETLRFIMAINKLVQSHPSTSKPKLQEPNPFDGSDPKKLCTFMFQCKLNFRDHKDLFNNEETKVNYTLYQSNMAIQVLI